MPAKWRWFLVAALMLSAAAGGARYYAQAAIPYYAGVSKLIALFRPWQVLSIKSAMDSQNQSRVLLLRAFVFRHANDPQPAALVVSRAQVGEVVETPLIFWGALLLWRGLKAPRWRVFLTGVPVFLLLEVLTTMCQLIQPLATASAILGGENDPRTFLDYWCRFLEGGGRFVIEVLAAAVAVAAAQRLHLSIHPAPHRDNNRTYPHVEC